MTHDATMTLGNFSVSLAVKDLAASRIFYQKLGFQPVGGDGERWQILRNGEALVGLFQGMFDRNTLTFNPGWNRECQPLETFTDVRDLWSRAKASGLEPVMATGMEAKGPASFMVLDPDGNPVLIDQHV